MSERTGQNARMTRDLPSQTTLTSGLESVKYRTVVVDPPWHYTRTGLSFEDADSGRFVGHGLPYPSMTLDEIAAIRIGQLAETDAHLYLWTTQKYLWAARDIVAGWGFQTPKVLIWCKPPHGFAMGGTFGNASEFVLFSRRGSLAAKTRVPRDWWEWPRGEHSAKPEAFLDLVEQVSPGPYLELFARRNRLGWDTWGNESLEHVEVK